MDNEVSIQDFARGCGRACPRSDPANMPGARSDDHPRGSITGSHPRVGVGAATVGTVDAGAIHQRAVIQEVAGRVSGTKEEILGQHLWARGYFCASVGTVDEKTIMEYIENQKWDEDQGGFKITVPSEP